MKQLRIALILLAMAVVLGAFGAHALKTRLTESSLEVWNTGVLYHFIHAIGVVLLAILYKMHWLKPRAFQASSWLMIIGIVFFSGSIYGLSTFDIHMANVKWLGPITPLGGLLFISGWLVAAFGLKSSGDKDSLDIAK
ncbi:MAG: DUF423 domain-containing protein [Flavobacteriales bacterium]